MKKFVFLLSLFLVFFAFTKVSFADTSYIYYYWQWCPHCANVDDYMKAVDGYEKLGVEKKEVYFDSENAAEMSADAERLGLESVGVPFLIVNEDWQEQTLVWDTPIIDYFTPILWEAPESNRKNIILIILAVLAVVIPFLIIKWPKK